jgi:hypothetical protein
VTKCVNKLHEEQITHIADLEKEADDTLRAKNIAHSTEIGVLQKAKEKDKNKICHLRQAKLDLQRALEHLQGQSERQRQRYYRVTHLCVIGNDAKLAACESKAASDKQENENRETKLCSLLFGLWAVYSRTKQLRVLSHHTATMVCG